MSYDCGSPSRQKSNFSLSSLPISNSRKKSSRRISLSSSSSRFFTFLFGVPRGSLMVMIGGGIPPSDAALVDGLSIIQNTNQFKLISATAVTAKPTPFPTNGLRLFIHEDTPVVSEQTVRCSKLEIRWRRNPKSVSQKKRQSKWRMTFSSRKSKSTSRRSSVVSEYEYKYMSQVKDRLELKVTTHDYCTCTSYFEIYVNYV